jgi:hypothetical protein
LRWGVAQPICLQSEIPAAGMDTLIIYEVLTTVHEIEDWVEAAPDSLHFIDLHMPSWKTLMLLLLLTTVCSDIQNDPLLGTPSLPSLLELDSSNSSKPLRSPNDLINFDVFFEESLGATLTQPGGIRWLATFLVPQDYQLHWRTVNLGESSFNFKYK